MTHVDHLKGSDRVGRERPFQQFVGGPPVAVAQARQTSLGHSRWAVLICGAVERLRLCCPPRLCGPRHLLRAGAAPALRGR